MSIAQRRQTSDAGRRLGRASVDVPLKIYAKCIDGDADRHRAKIEAAPAH